jgi:MFS family permease
VLSPELSHHLGIENKGAFFIYYVLSTIVVRLVTGRISDRIGRPKMLLIGMSLLTLSMLLIGVSNTPNWYTFSSIIFGIATGTSSPTLFAWTADLAPVNRRGIGTGTMFIALEFGIFSGSGLTNELYDHQLNSIFPIFLVGACMAFATVIYLIGFLIRTAKK